MDISKITMNFPGMGKKKPDPETQEIKSQASEPGNGRSFSQGVTTVKDIISPSAVGAAPKGLKYTGSPLMNLPWTYAGLPTLSIPAGKSSNNLPLGIQIAGKYQKDEELIAFSPSLEKIFDDLY